MHFFFQPTIMQSFEVASEASTVQRSPHFWFADGNVTLQAENTQFRLFRSTLAEYSETLKDCFSLPQPPDEPTVEGCQVIHLHDSAREIENFYFLLFGPPFWYDFLSPSLLKMFYSRVDPGKVIPVPYLKTMITLGRKYEVSILKTKALAHLQYLFPNNLTGWEATSDVVRKLVDGNKSFLFDVINLALAYEFYSILPAAFLNMCILHDIVCFSQI